jgi:hypothetical protein
MTATDPRGREYRSAPREGTPISATGRPEHEYGAHGAKALR